MADTNVSPKWHVAGAIAAWLAPGLGHWLLGQRQKAMILFLSINFLWIGGFFIGGVGIFDRKAHPIWYVGQMLIAPSILVEKWHTSLQGPNVAPPRPDADVIPFKPSYGHIHEQGVLYTALAGMLNLLAIMDVLYQDPAARSRKPAPVAPGPKELAAAATTETTETSGGAA